MKLVALGSNLSSQAGDPAATLRAALDALKRRNIGILCMSRFYNSPAWPNPDEPPFVNAVAQIATKCSPFDLLANLHAVEEEYGRVRTGKNAPRTLDLDIIDYDGLVAEGSPRLPHPRIAARAFVLMPLRDVAPQWRHPVTGETVEALIAQLPEADRTSTVPVSAEPG